MRSVGPATRRLYAPCSLFRFSADLLGPHLVPWGCHETQGRPSSGKRSSVGNHWPFKSKKKDLLGVKMAYDMRGIFEVVRETLEKAPLTSLHQLSRNLTIERHTIEKAIRTESGESFRSFRRGIAFEIARDRLISCPDLSIKEVAYALGFRSSRTFSRFIRDTCGYTPIQLRRIRTIPDSN